MKLEQFLDLLVCPVTHQPLSLSSDRASLLGPAGEVYGVEKAVPILLTSEDRSQFADVLASAGVQMAAEYAASAQPQAAAPAAEIFPPQRLPAALIHEAYNRKGEATRILSVGGGPTRNDPREINLNIAPFPGVDLVANALRLPFATGTVDAVWSNAVLEHVAGAEAAVREMIRVVEPGGYVVNLVPFMQPIHAYPQDFQRYTSEGLAYLMGELDILEHGEAVGPSFALYELLGKYLDGPGQHTLPRWVRGLARRTLLPALHRAIVAKLDWKFSSQLMPSLVYCVGRKRS
jgi:SAM-dependent methyltransferase